MTAASARVRATQPQYLAVAPRATAKATRGNTTAGMVMFHAVEGGLMLHVRVSGLKPGQEHGFHVHEKGDCSSGDGMSTGGHYNPAASRTATPGRAITTPAPGWPAR